MSRLQDAVRWIQNTCKIRNVYDCARPLLLLLGLFGAGSTCISNTDGGYSLCNNRFSYLVMGVLVFCMPIWLVVLLTTMFSIEGLELHTRINMLIVIFTISLTMFTICTGYIMTIASWKRLNRVLQIIQHIDSQLEEENIRVKLWQITLTVMVLALTMVIYVTVPVLLQADSSKYFVLVSLVILFQLFHAWVILFLLMIHERFACVNKLLQQNAPVINIQIVGERNARDHFMLRRISLARHVHEQLSEVVHLFSDSCRWMVVGMFLTPTMFIIKQALALVFYEEFKIYLVPSNVITIVLLTGICQASKNQRRVLNARLRHLVAFETDREIIQQVQQYIMYNAYCVKGPIDFQFTDIDNVLLLAIIDVIASNILIIYSYNR